VGCSNFNGEQATKDAEKQLYDLFNKYDDGEILSNTNDKSEIKRTIKHKFNNYFTEDYRRKINQEIDHMKASIIESNLDHPVVFFLKDGSEMGEYIVKFNKYDLSKEGIVTDVDNHSVQVEIDGDRNPAQIPVNVIFKEEDGMMKIDHVEDSQL